MQGANFLLLYFKFLLLLSSMGENVRFCLLFWEDEVWLCFKQGDRLFWYFDKPPPKIKSDYSLNYKKCYVLQALDVITAILMCVDFYWKILDSRGHQLSHWTDTSWYASCEKEFWRTSSIWNHWVPTSNLLHQLRDGSLKKCTAEQ